MQTTPRPTRSKNESKKDETLSGKKEEKKKVITAAPRNFIQKTSAADIYGQKKPNNLQVTRTPKKLHGPVKITNNVSPMKDLLRSSPSSDSHKVKKETTKSLHSARDVRPVKSLLLTNVTVNSPVAKRRILQEGSDLKSPISYRKTVSQEKNTKIHEERDVNLKNKVGKSREATSVQERSERERSKTRTLDESEVKILTPDTIDNNKEMFNLTQKLKAKPKAFFVELDDPKAKPSKSNSSEGEDVSYEDDFESYESDFESYHSESQNHDTKESLHSDDEIVCNDDIEKLSENNDELHQSDKAEIDERHGKEIKDEEKMLDSGSYDLRDRSAKSKALAMEFILEDSEVSNDKKVSLTDEGFQEMSSSSTASSMRTIHTDILDKPLFVDFSKLKENKRKRLMNERIRQRAKDLLDMITLHEMSFSLFEMKPISYDLFMATFGRNNYKQTAAQTFDDGIHVEIQTDLGDSRHIWTQYPVEFSKSDIAFQKVNFTRKYSLQTEEYLKNFSFLAQSTVNSSVDDKIESELNYELNPLRVYFEQKDGVGTAEMLPYETYKNKLKCTDHNSDRLKKFLKKVEGKVSNILSFNSGNNELSALKNTRFNCSKGYVSISTKMVENEKYTFLKRYKINKIIYSDTKSNLILSISTKNELFRKSIICLWDLSIANKDPIKILIAIDDVNVGVFRGNTDGIFVAALDDGSLHLWDLSDEPTWRADDCGEEKSPELLEVENAKLSQMTKMEKDREWNMMNSNVGSGESKIDCAFQICAYTNSACNIFNQDETDNVVGLEFCGGMQQTVYKETGKRIIAQIASLQRIGLLTIWSVVQEKSKTPGLGRAYWSMLKLEKNQNIHLSNYVDALFENNVNSVLNFNLTLAKRRNMRRKHEKKIYSRPKMAVTSKFNRDRPTSAVFGREINVLPAHKTIQIWENNIICKDMKIINSNNILTYVIAKNNGEVLCCRRTAGVFKVEKILISNDTSSVIYLEMSPHNLPYFLAATDSGTVNLCSIIEKRVLLTLDCRNNTSSVIDKCKADHKGRYISSVRSPLHSLEKPPGFANEISILSLQWSNVNPCCFYALLKDGTLLAWDLMQSDIYAKVVGEKLNGCVARGNNLALLTSEGDVQIHILTNEQKTKEYVDLFQKYIALL